MTRSSHPPGGQTEHRDRGAKRLPSLGRLTKELREDWSRHVASGSPRAFFAVANWRIGKASLQLPKPLRWVASGVYHASALASEAFTGVYLDRSTDIGEALHLVHAGNINIHPGTQIGDRVGIMHGVTLGSNMTEGAPVLGNDVFIGANASILGEVTIGDGARIAANTLVISDVPPGATAIGVPAKILKLPNSGATTGDTTKAKSQ